MLSVLEHTQHSAPGHTHTHTHTDPAGLQDTPADTAWDIPVHLPLTTHYHQTGGGGMKRISFLFSLVEMRDQM